MLHVVHLGIVFVFSVLSKKIFKLHRLSIIFIPIYPFLLFYSDDTYILIFSLILGVLLALSFLKRTTLYLFLSLAVITLVSIIYKPQFAIDRYSVTINFINQQRGEHTQSNSTVSRIFHNKLAIYQSVINSIQKNISLVALFTHAQYKNINVNYPLGYLFPYDIILFFFAIRKTINGHKRKLKEIFYVPRFLILIIFFGFISLTTNKNLQLISSYAIVYALLIYLIKFISAQPSKIRTLYLLSNILFSLITLFLLNDFFI